MDTNEPHNEDPEIIGTAFQTVIDVLQLYGWFILFVIIAVLYLGSKVRPWLDQLSQQRDINSYKKMDSGVAQSRLEAMERARLKMQAQLDEEAKRFAERQKAKEEEKRNQRLEDWERHCQGKGYRSKTKAPEERPTPALVKSKAKKPLKPEYNPLMGSDAGACYRPQRSGRSGGG
uniref:Selenoprotein S n=1 Tax=Arion vulgaris TaxID=1028688 RepID=A0A0B7B5N6_9EUPU